MTKKRRLKKKDAALTTLSPEEKFADRLYRSGRRRAESEAHIREPARKP